MYSLPSTDSHSVRFMMHFNAGKVCPAERFRPIARLFKKEGDNRALALSKARVKVFKQQHSLKCMVQVASGMGFGCQSNGINVLSRKMF